MSFPRYPKYKHSGVEWLGEVPEHWRVCRIKNISQSIEQGWSPQCEGSPVDSADEWGVLKVGCVNGGTFRAVENKGLPADMEPVPKLVLRADDLLISRANTRELVGSAAVVMEDHPRLMLCDKLYRLRFGAAFSPSFVSRYLQTTTARGQIELGATGASSSMLNIGQSTILNLEIAIPDIVEQSRITAFLDRETSKIDALVAEQRRLMELLKEKRQAVISHAVTKGLNPDAPMKDSGIEWLGEVPAHWEVKQMKRLATIRYGIGEPPKYYDEGTPLIRATNVHGGNLFAKGLVFVDPSEIPEQRIVWLEAGDIIVVRSGAYTGDSAIVPEDFGRCIAGFDMVLRCCSAIPEFVQFALLSTYLKEGQIDLEKMRAAQPHLNAEELGSCVVAIPGTHEQNEIVDFLRSRCAEFDALVSEIQRAIDLLLERRTALISAAVTGQIDVRPSARTLTPA